MKGNPLKERLLPFALYIFRSTNNIIILYFSALWFLQIGSEREPIEEILLDSVIFLFNQSYYFFPLTIFYSSVANKKTMTDTTKSTCILYHIIHQNYVISEIAS